MFDPRAKAPSWVVPSPGKRLVLFGLNLGHLRNQIELGVRVDGCRCVPPGKNKTKKKLWEEQFYLFLQIPKTTWLEKGQTTCTIPDALVLVSVQE